MPRRRLNEIDKKEFDVFDYLGLFTCHAWTKRVDDGQVPVATDGHHRVGWDKDWNGLREADYTAHSRSKWPVKENKCRHKGERYAKKRHQNISGSHIDYKEIGDGPLSDAGENDGAHNHVPNQSQHENNPVETVDDDLKESRWGKRISDFFFRFIPLRTKPRVVVVSWEYPVR